MKQPKKLSVKQKTLLSKVGLDYATWMCRFEDKTYLHIIHKDTREVKVIDKISGELVEATHEKSPALAKATGLKG